MSSNRRAQNCARCGKWVEAGAGILVDNRDDDEGLGGPSWLVFCQDRDACVGRRKAQDDEARAHQAAKDVFEAEFNAIADIARSGEYPTGPLHLVNEKLAGERNIYGGGSWFVVEGGYVWYLINNGMDGDDWSRSNVDGAIGYRIAETPELVRRVTALDTTYRSRKAAR